MIRFGLLLAMLASPLAAKDILVIEVAGKSNGIIEIELSEDTPNHSERLKTLATDGAYDGVVFHRVIDGFMAQTGDVEHGQKDGVLRFAGMGGSKYPDLSAEFNETPYVTGTVGMARSQAVDSANSQFFIMFDDAPFLNGQYTVVGQVIAGQDVVDAIKRGNPAQNGTVAQPDYMKSVTVRTTE